MFSLLLYTGRACVTVMHSKFDVGSSCDKRQENDKAPLFVVELAWWVFASTQFAELEAWAEPAFPAGNNNPTVVCCHGISTKMLFLSRSSQHNEVAYETVDLTLCFVICCSYVYPRNHGFCQKIYMVTCYGGSR